MDGRSASGILPTHVLKVTRPSPYLGYLCCALGIRHCGIHKTYEEDQVQDPLQHSAEGALNPFAQGMGLEVFDVGGINFELLGSQSMA